MKNHVISFLFVLLSLLCTACNEDTTFLSVNKTTIEFTADGGTEFFTIETDASTWTIEHSNPDWLSISSTEGTGPKAMITLSTKGRVLEPQSTILYIKAGNSTVELLVSQASADYIYTLSASAALSVFTELQQSTTLSITGNVPSWTATCAADWIHLSENEGTSSKEITLTIDQNSTGNERFDSVLIAGDGAKTCVIVLKQKGPLYPSYNTNPIAADISNMTRTATQIAADIDLGWNLGNSLEAIGGETNWGNAKATQRLIDSIAARGINAIRIPCAWNQYSNGLTAKIGDTWLARVKEVVDYCVNRNIYVLLNVHWDGGWLDGNCTTSKQYETNAKQKAFWEQIATYFRDYNDYLLFAGCNEPSVENATQMSVLLSYEQTFIDAVRATGGRNAYRTLVVQGPATDIDKTYTLMKTLPTDPTSGRMMAEVHYYTPYQFCLMESDATWGNMFYFWGANYHYNGTIDGINRNANWGEEDDMRTLFGKMRTQFVNKGIPVILGEYCATRRSNLPTEVQELHNQSRAYFHEYVTQQAKIYGMVPFYWDNGGSGNLASGIFNRSSGVVFDPVTMSALVRGASAGVYPY